MADDATLRDTVVSDDAPAAPAVDTPPAAPASDSQVDKDALEIAQVLIGSGVTRDQINDLLQAPKALESLRYAIQNNPQEFLNMLDRTDPQTGEKFLEAMADTYVNRYGEKTPKAQGKQDASGELMRQVEALRDELKSVRTREEQREAATAMAATRQRYTARVDDLFGEVKQKGIALTKAEEKALRARLDVELSTDPNVVKRASSGNFVDVSPAFKAIIEEWASDKKEAAKAAEAQRDRASKGAFADFQSGPNFANLELPKGTSDSWDNTELGFAKALESLAR